MLKALLIMNLVDAFATMVWVETGVAEEANPLMSWALEDNVGFFILSKVFLVIFSVLLLWRSREHRVARILTVPVFLLYAYIISIHIFISFNLIFYGGL